MKVSAREKPLNLRNAKTLSYHAVFILVFFLFGTAVSSQEQVIVSLRVGDCNLSVESGENSQTVRLRAHHPKYKGCQIDKDSMTSILDAALSKTDPPNLDRNYSSISIGRLIDYPWMCQYLATTAYRDPKWNSRRGKPATIDINKYVSELLFRRDLISPIDAVLGKYRYGIVGVTVEKVLVGGFREVPFYQGEMKPGRVPYDAQVWFRLEIVR